MLTEAWLMLQTWGRLRHLLLELDRLPLRQTLLALKALSWGTVWKMSGNVFHHRDLSQARLRESLQHLQHETARFPEKHPRAAAQDFGPKAVGKQLRVLDESLAKSDDWCALHFSQAPKDKPARFHPGDLGIWRKFQEELAITAGVVFVGILKPGWELLGRSPVLKDDAGHDKLEAFIVNLKQEDIPVMKVRDISTEKPATESLERLVRAGEELFCLLYVGFIQNILGRIRTMTFSIMILFIAATLSVACYPFDPRPLLGGTFLVSLRGYRGHHGFRFRASASRPHTQLHYQHGSRQA